MTESFRLEPAIGAKSDRLKRLRRLVRQRKARSEERAFVAEGPVLVVEALRSPTTEVLEIYAEEPADPRVEAAAAQAALGIQPVVGGALASVLDTVTPQPVCAVVRTAEAAIADLPVAGPLLVLVELRDPGNVGTLLRTAEAAGFGAVVITGEAVDSTNPKVVRSAAGARFRLPVATVLDAEAAFVAIRAGGRTIVATVVDPAAAPAAAPAAGPGGHGAIEPYDQVDLANAAIVLGNEAHGLDAVIAQAADVRATIPLAGPTESLNVAAAGAVLCFESLRQRRQADSPQFIGRIPS